MDEEPGDQVVRRQQVKRRRILVAGAALGTGGLLMGSVAGLPRLANVIAGAALGAGRPGSAPSNVRIERVYSQARGREVDLVTLLPGRPVNGGGRLPVCLFLHGRNGNARRAAPAALDNELVATVSRGAIPPFAFVALDGGNNYWHEKLPGDNSMAMLLDEVPRWLAERGLGDAGGQPFASAGVSMGGFGALLYARRRVERGQPMKAVAAISPALFTSWREMSTRAAFRDAAQWAAVDPLRNVDKLNGLPVAIWCGTEDHFIDGSRQFIELADPEIAHTGPGRHGDAFNGRIVPELLGFLGKHAPRHAGP